MTQADIDDVVAAFAKAAADAERVGFDGVELHGAHGYLIDQFLWAGTNRRTDAYGGDPVARTRFAVEIVQAVRSAVSPGFPVVFRFSQWKADHYDARLAETPEELEAILTPLATAGVDAFHASTRRYWLPEFDGSDLNLAKLDPQADRPGPRSPSARSAWTASSAAPSWVRAPRCAASTTSSTAWSATSSTWSRWAGRSSRTRVGGQGAGRALRRADVVRRGVADVAELTF